MRTPALNAVFFSIAARLVCAGESLYGGLSYTQRGILETGGEETPVTVYVRSSGGKTAMQMESQLGMLCRLEAGPDGTASVLEGSPLFRESWVRDYVLRDLLIVTGARPPSDFAGESYAISFGRFEYSKAHGRLIPMEVDIRGERYRISLKTLSVRE